MYVYDSMSHEIARHIFRILQALMINSLLTLTKLCESQICI